MEVRAYLPAHPVPAAALRANARPQLRVAGLVERPRTLEPADLWALPRVQVEEPFACEEGWQTAALTWEGMSLLKVLDLARPRSGASWVRVSAGDYAVPLSLKDASTAILAERLNGQPLGVEHGGPWRLVAPGASCFTSVKWVDSLELTTAPSDQSGERIARARLSRSG